MKPPPFDYVAPTRTEEAIALLQEHGEDAKILAGGQSLVPLLNFRLARPRVLIDINGIEELSFIEESDGGLRIGSLTRQRVLETSPLIKAKCPLLTFAARFIGHVAIRNRGTFGGSLAHADPAAELPLLLTVLGGRVVARSPGGRRTLAAAEFFRSYLTTALEPNEMLVEGWIPALDGRTGWGFHELTLQHGAFAMVAAAALLRLDERGICRDARVGFGGVNPVPTRAEQAENLLRNKKPTAALLAEAARRAREAAEPLGDIHASAEYRAAMTEVYVRRALLDAYARAR